MKGQTYLRQDDDPQEVIDHPADWHPDVLAQAYIRAYGNPVLALKAMAGDYHSVALDAEFSAPYAAKVTE